jgi:hypothetical protein
MRCGHGTTAAAVMYRNAVCQLGQEQTHWFA